MILQHPWGAAASGQPSLVASGVRCVDSCHYDGNPAGLGSLRPGHVATTDSITQDQPSMFVCPLYLSLSTVWHLPVHLYVSVSCAFVPLSKFPVTHRSGMCVQMKSYEARQQHKCEANVGKCYRRFLPCLCLLRLSSELCLSKYMFKNHSTAGSVKMTLAINSKLSNIKCTGLIIQWLDTHV